MHLELQHFRQPYSGYWRMGADALTRCGLAVRHSLALGRSGRDCRNQVRTREGAVSPNRLSPYPVSSLSHSGDCIGDGVLSVT